MIKTIFVGDALKLNLPIVDVRSPGEFTKGHINRAINIPIFSDSERADLGHIYKNISPETAIEKGYFYVNPKLDNLKLLAEEASNDKNLIVHCWRGGMRSNSFAKFLDQNGFNEVYVIEGGYKAYRNYALETFDSDFNIVLLGGYTGSGKTFILKEIKSIGEQVIDLEALANHKGSTFGGINQPPQTTTEQFENNLHHELLKVDHRKVLWLEDESHNIGRNEIPHNFFAQMQKSKLIFLDIPQAERAKHLVDEYSICNKEKLVESIMHISKRLGGLNLKNALYYLENDMFFEVALIALGYYDKSYFQLMQNRNIANVIRLKLKNIQHHKNAEIVLKTNYP
jgi:tRNA 2-selenouridine synthase